MRTTWKGAPQKTIKPPDDCTLVFGWGLTLELTGPLRWAGIWARLLEPEIGPPQSVRLSEWLDHAHTGVEIAIEHIGRTLNCALLDLVLQRVE